MERLDYLIEEIARHELWPLQVQTRKMSPGLSCIISQCHQLRLFTKTSSLETISKEHFQVTPKRHSNVYLVCCNASHKLDYH